jgi:hypothetical protein
MELRGCWEPRPAGPAINVLTKVLDDAARIRRGRAPMPAFAPEEAPAARAFVPVESVTSDRSIATPDDGEDELASADVSDAAQPLAPFVIEPDPGWSERTSLFGDQEG